MTARHHYLELDGLRGVAAVSVVLLHLRHLYGPVGETLFNRHLYLAGDFFLLLSGFVIAFGYEERLQRPDNRRSFIRDRVIRLYPLLILGVVVGAVTLNTVALHGRSELPHRVFLAATGMIPLPLPN